MAVQLFIWTSNMQFNKNSQSTRRWTGDYSLCVFGLCMFCKEGVIISIYCKICISFRSTYFVSNFFLGVVPFKCVIKRRYQLTIIGLCIVSHVWTDEYGAFGEWYWQGKAEVLGETPVPVSLGPPQTPHGMTWDWNRASAVRVRQTCLSHDADFLVMTSI
jgi:hypothetical protein